MSTEEGPREPVSGEFVKVGKQTVRASPAEGVHVCLCSSCERKERSGESHFSYNPGRTLDFLELFA